MKKVVVVLITIAALVVLMPAYARKQNIGTQRALSESVQKVKSKAQQRPSILVAAQSSNQKGDEANNDGKGAGWGTLELEDPRTIRNPEQF